jgi:shikimate kinase / 3-dehydroquinate synthase
LAAVQERTRVERGMAPPNIVLFGPPASGKTSVGRALAGELERPFVDTDGVIESRAGKGIARLMAEDGEGAFREIEAGLCQELALEAGLVIACGGGALLNETTRRLMVRSGVVVCLRCEASELSDRMDGSAERPLLAGDREARLRDLLNARQSVYDSFPRQVDTTGVPIPEVVKQVQTVVEAAGVQTFHVDQAEGYPVYLGAGLLSDLPRLLGDAGLEPPVVVVSDSTVSRLYGLGVGRRLGAKVVEVPAGERSKSLQTVQHLYEAFGEAGLERKGTVVAVGGGVVSDLAGFAAATYLRGVRWAILPTTLLAMADASVGGKVGVDLPGGKNLVGAFHPPAVVIADTDTLGSLPLEELRGGLAEVVKAAMIGDPDLFQWIEQSRTTLSAGWIGRALSVKIQVVEEDPREVGRRAVLNFGHTVGHGLEVASGYRLAHGQAVAIGMVAETIMAERLGLAKAGLAERLRAVLEGLGLPSRFAELPAETIRDAMQSDKKRRDGSLQFSLPVEVGDVRHGVEVPAPLLAEGLREIGDGV